MCTQTQAKRILQQSWADCANVMGGVLRDAYLYGSYARGDFHKESDVDILLTADADAEQLNRYRRQVAVIASDLSLEHNVTVSITLKPAEHFRRYASALPFYADVLKESVHYAG